MQRNSFDEKVTLIGAAQTRCKDEVLLVFKTISGGHAEFFTAVLYLSRQAAHAAEIVGAWYREVRSKAKTYWVNAEWGSWSCEAVISTAAGYGVAHVSLQDLRAALPTHL